MASREDRAVLKGLGEMLMDRVSKHATGRQWNEWLKVPLEVALRLGDSELASRLLVAGSVARVGSSSKETHPLLLTAFAERGQDKQEPCASRAGVDFTSPGAFTAALHEAVEYGKLGDVQALFEAGAKPGNRQEKGLLLHSAIRRGDADIVSELLGRGADADIPDLDGRSPLRSAVSTCSWPIVTVLLERGAGASATMLGGPNGMASIVKAAARKGQPRILRALHTHGADVDARDKGNYTALHHAAMLGKPDSISALVEAGADVNATNPNNGCTALHWAARNGHSKAMVALLRHGSNVNVQDDEGRTPLHRACSVDDARAAEAAELLLIWGADDATVNKNGHTAQDYVRRRQEASHMSNKDPSALAGLRRMLDSSSVDRGWCRRGLVILGKSRLGQEGMGTILERLVTMAEEELFESAWGSMEGD